MSYLLAVLGLCLLVIIYIIRRQWESADLPPGPHSDPLIGHLRYMPSTKSADEFHQWAKEYGALALLNDVENPCENQSDPR